MSDTRLSVYAVGYQNPIVEDRPPAGPRARIQGEDSLHFTYRSNWNGLFSIGSPNSSLDGAGWSLLSLPA
jgi:hypothetical protein